LTPAEQQVADRAAQGMSNPDIARDLHVSRSTVETHLKRVYAKLGIDGRHQLPRYS
jgi:DNA-binding CsgD family transcriptional regulator